MGLRFLLGWDILITKTRNRLLVRSQARVSVEARHLKRRVTKQVTDCGFRRPRAC